MHCPSGDNACVGAEELTRRVRSICQQCGRAVGQQLQAISQQGPADASKGSDQAQDALISWEAVEKETLAGLDAALPDLGGRQAKR